jgi:hypothetical protein
MKYSIIIIFFGLLFFSCGKSKNSNILIGKWNQMQQVSQYINPYTFKTEFDTSAGISLSIEFKSDDNFFTNGLKDGTYTISNDTSFSLKPPGNVSGYFYSTYRIITIGNGLLKTRRDGYSGEQKQVFDPNMQGMFKYANIQYVFNDYHKE